MLGPPFIHTIGSERGWPDGAWTMATPTRIIRLFAFDRFSGTASVPQSTFRFGKIVPPDSMLFGHGTSCSDGALALPAPPAKHSATPMAAKRLARLIPRRPYPFEATDATQAGPRPYMRVYPTRYTRSGPATSGEYLPSGK